MTRNGTLYEVIKNDGNPANTMAITNGATVLADQNTFFMKEK